MDKAGGILAAAGAAGFALAAWALARRRTDAVTLARRIGLAEREADRALGALEAFDGAVLRLDGAAPALAGGSEALAACAQRLGVAPEPQAVLQALIAADPGLAVRLTTLGDIGEGFDAEIGGVMLAGRALGALCWLRLSPAPPAPPAAAFGEGQLAEALYALGDPAWLADASGAAIWANAAWLKAVDARDMDDARARRLSFDPGAEALAREAAAAGDTRAALRWIAAGTRRRAFRITARPLHAGAVALTAQDATEAEEAREALNRHIEAQGETLDRLGEAVAIFSADRALLFSNAAFAALWSLEPAWLAEGPDHGEILDRLRQRRRLPAAANYAAWKAAEFERYHDLGSGAEEIWPLPDGRTLRVARQLHPMGGLLILFSDITDELKLKAQYNALIQVQQATLDKLSDAVAVFGSDGRLRLHNEAFAAFWGAGAAQLDAAGDFDGVVALAIRRAPDMHLWTGIKGRVTDTDPEARAPQAGETLTAEERILAWQTRPLPDGATLLAFADVTDTRRLEGALADREAALEDTERLKRDFVANVSYELRTPLTTVLGYAELLSTMTKGLSERARDHIGSVYAAATQLNRLIGDVLDMAQLDAGDLTLNIDETPVAALLRSAAGRWAADAATAEAVIDIDCPDDIGAIRADARRLGQVLDQLLENAVRQAPKGSAVTLSARRAFGEVQIQVSDEGRGIPYHVQAHIFDRFVGRDRGGPGLGMALVKALVELHGGWVALESEPGAGASFMCHLPEEAYGGQIDAG